MKADIKLVAVDMDGTFIRSSAYTYDVDRFKRIFARMKDQGCRFVVASGNQYYQLRDQFPGFHQELSFVAENGGLVKDQEDWVFTADIPKDLSRQAIHFCRQYPEIDVVISALNSAYCERGSVDQAYFDMISVYCHRLAWLDDFLQVDDQILKFSLTVPKEKTKFYYHLLEKEFQGQLVPTSSGLGSIDLILPGCHKASGLQRLVDRWGISPDQCLAFGDGGNDIEMLKYCGLSYAMENAGDHVKAAAKAVCPSNEEDGVLVILEQFFPG